MTANFLQRVVDLEPLLNRRRDRRFPCERVARCQPLGTNDDAVATVMVRDISPGGVRLSASRPFERGALLTLRFETKPNMVVVMRVLRVEDEQPGTWTVCGRVARRISAREAALAAMSSFGGA
jgi:hypothetical protein